MKARAEAIAATTERLLQQPKALLLPAELRALLRAQAALLIEMAGRLDELEKPDG
jgi:hypothetical protein